MITENDIQNLFLRSITDIDITECNLPISLQESKELLNEFSKPDYPDHYNFKIDLTDKLKEELLFTIRLFLGGRVIGSYEKKKKEPDTFQATIKIGDNVMNFVIRRKRFEAGRLFSREAFNKFLDAIDGWLRINLSNDLVRIETIYKEVTI